MQFIRKVLHDIFNTAGNAPGVFVSIWLGLFLVFAVGLVALGVGPDALVDDVGDSDKEEFDSETEATITDSEPPRLVDESTSNEVVLSASTEAEPVRLIVSSVGIDTPVVNPDAQDIDVLNQSLNDGAVRYPGSGNLEDITNMFIFGHSSHLPVVNNDAYKALNDLEDVVPGDLIRVQSETKEYHYRVTSVELVSAENAWVTFNSDIKKLTLSTCNNFGSKQDRYVVEAEWIGEFGLGT